MLVIDQLKSVFRRPGDFMPRMQTRRNWRPEFLTRYFRENRRDCNGECNVVSRHSERSYVPEAPKIYSIGLNSGARSLSDSNNLPSSCGATRNFKKRFNVLRRPTKYWTGQSTSTSSLPIDVSLKEHTNCQTTAIECAKSPDVPKHDQSQKDYRNNQSYEQTEQKHQPDTLRDDRVACFFLPDDFNDSSMKRDKCGRSCVTRDAEIQTISRKSSRRRRKNKRSRTTSEGVSHCERRDESREHLIANFHVDSHSSNGGDHLEKSRLCVRALENKRAEYINKFTAVNRQIEEITATLRETCYGDENSPYNLRNYEEHLSYVSDDAKMNTGRKSNDNESKSAIVTGRLKEKDDLTYLEGTVGESESDRPEGTREILRADDINNETPDSSRKNCPKNIISVPMSTDRYLNNIFVCDAVRASLIEETIHPSNETSKNSKEARCRFVKRISFDVDLTTKDDAEPQEFSIEGKSFDGIYLRNNFVITDDKHTKDLIGNFVVSEESRYRRKIVEEKLGEIAILEDIKKRIDRDFDDRATGKSETGTDDFLSVSQKSSDLDRQFYETEPMRDATSLVRTIEASKSTPSIVAGSRNLDSNETQIRDSLSVGAMSEYSNKNSVPSKYFSCTQFPSLISLTEDDNEIEDGAVIVRNTHLDLRSKDYNYYDYSQSSLDSSLDRTRSDDVECKARYDRDKFLIEAINEADDTFEVSEAREGIAEDKIREHRCPFGESKREERESRVDFQKRYAVDTTLETSKSRYIGSIDSGVFSSSLIDLYPTESSLDAGKSTRFERKRRSRKHDGSSPVADLSSDGSYTDDTLDCKVNDVVRDLTENLILCERSARMKLREMRKARYSRNPLSRSCKFNRDLYDSYGKFFISSERSSEDERIVGISTPSLLSLSDSEIEDRESKCRL